MITTVSAVVLGDDKVMICVQKGGTSRKHKNIQIEVEQIKIHDFFLGGEKDIVKCERS